MFNGNAKVNDENGNNLQKEDQGTRMNEHFCSVLNRRSENTAAIESKQITKLDLYCSEITEEETRRLIEN